MNPIDQKKHSENLDANRRKILGILGAIGAVSATSGLIGCGGGNSNGSVSSSSAASITSSSASSASSISNSSSAAGCALIPTETLGPYPLSTLLDSSGILREAINEDKTGAALTIKLKLVDVNNQCTPVSGYVYIWHCDKDGLYSGYDTSTNLGQNGKTYCRGIQYTDNNGQATFTTIYPGWYAGRITHVHMQVFLTSYSSGANSTAVSQMAFPMDITTAVYNSTLYTKGQNTSVTSLSNDNVFSDGTTYQMATITGNVADGYVAELEVGIAVS